jgi:Tfp pilus assembly protein PilO
MENRSSKSSLLSLLLLVLILVVGVAYLKPLWDEVSQLNLGLEEKASKKASLDTELQNLRNLQASLATTTEVGKSKVLAAIPERLEQDKLITQITAIAKKTDVVLNSISFSIPTGTNQKVKKAVVSANLAGGYGDLVSFLRGVEGNERKLVVKSVTVQFGQTQGIARANFNVSMEAYYQDRI